jgi:hypothetical protein
MNDPRVTPPSAILNGTRGIGGTKLSPLARMMGALPGPAPRARASFKTQPISSRSCRTKLNPEVQRRICQAVAKGHYFKTAAIMAGRNPDTVQNWFDRGAREASGIYRRFHQAILKARLRAEARAIQHVVNAADGDWKASAWWLTHGPAKMYWGANRAPWDVISRCEKCGHVNLPQQAPA